MLKVGDECVCIGYPHRDMWHPDSRGGDMPIKGEIYTITETTTILSTVKGFRFAELKNAPACWYWAHWFRPVAKTKAVELEAELA